MFSFRQQMQNVSVSSEQKAKIESESEYPSFIGWLSEIGKSLPIKIFQFMFFLPFLSMYIPIGRHKASGKPKILYHRYKLQAKVFCICLAL